MSEREEWSDWFVHDGRGCPLKRGVVAHVWLSMRDGTADAVTVIDYDDITCPTWEGQTYGWSYDIPMTFDGRSQATRWVTHYRIRKPRALEQLREIAANPPRVGKPVGVPA